MRPELVETADPSDLDDRDDRDGEDDVTITPYLDGPLIVRGPVRLQGADGTPIVSGRDTIALCRCGRSMLKPFCDGSHAATGFRAAAGDERPERGTCS